MGSKTVRIMKRLLDRFNPADDWEPAEETFIENLEPVINTEDVTKLYRHHIIDPHLFGISATQYYESDDISGEGHHMIAPLSSGICATQYYKLDDISGEGRQ